MANRLTPAQQHLFRYRSFQIDKSQPLGHGSYGAVYKAKCDELPCAAKVLHPTILDPMDPGADKIRDRFSQECALLESIRHPNIVQYLAMTVDPESRLPVLLMELLDESLTKMLECSQQSLAYYIQVDICHDVALAISYLHSNNIIHRDLSSNNVLIIAGRRAKVTDFGMSKLAGAAIAITPLTMCPAYMPPEALRDPPRFIKKLDCFSEGVIMIQVCTRLWPKPRPRTQLVPDSRSPTGSIEMPLLETERRKNHIDMIDPNHALLPIAMDCLKYQEGERPSSEELCQRLAGLKDSQHYRDNVRQSKDSQVTSTQNQQLKKELQDKKREIHDKEKEIYDKKKEIQDKERMIHDQEREIYDKEREIQDKEWVIQDKDTMMERELQDKNRVITSLKVQLQQLNQQIEEQEHVTAEVQQANNSLQRQVEELQQQLSQQLQIHTNSDCKMTLNWREQCKAPIVMSRGAAVVDRGVAYFMSWNGQACSYNKLKKSWSKLPKYPYQHSTIAIINGQLTSIGGCENWLKKHTYTNKLFSLRGSWSDVFPPMPTKRRGTTAVTSKEHLIVAGGTNGPDDVDYVSKVDVMDTKTLVWSTVASLPHPYNFGSATICGDHLYMLGGYDDKDKTKSVQTCSLTELLQSSSSSSLSVWHRVADAPTYLSTCAAVNGQLLAVGGCDESYQSTAAIYKYNQRTNTWDHISDMLTARYGCLVAFLPTNEIMAVGGMITGRNTDKVEIASFTIII